MAELHIGRQLRCCAARPRILYEIRDFSLRNGIGLRRFMKKRLCHRCHAYSKNYGSDSMQSMNHCYRVGLFLVRHPLAPSGVASATSSYRASVHPPEGFYLIGNGVISHQIKKEPDSA